MICLYEPLQRRPSEQYDTDPDADADASGLKRHWTIPSTIFLISNNMCTRIYDFDLRTWPAAYRVHTVDAWFKHQW
jgi:hypothetical protein